MRRQTLIGFVLAVLVSYAGGVLAQEILLDENIKAGKLMCFRDFGDPKKYYYLADQPHVALKDSGLPEFAFIKYVKNVAREGEGGIEEGEGGGVVTCLMSYEVSEDDRREAERVLQQMVPGAKLAGPIIYRSGSYAVTTPLASGEDEASAASGSETIKFINQIFATGKAPVLEGHKCAVAMRLTKEGATLLWESFKMATSQVSVVYEMEVKGYRNPFEATIIADWSKITKHDQLQAGVKAAWFGADLDMLWQELRQNGSVQIIQKGEDANMEKILAEAQRIIMERIFDKQEMPDLATMASQAGGQNAFSTLDRAVRYMQDDENRRRSRASGTREGRTTSTEQYLRWPILVELDPSDPSFYLIAASEPDDETTTSTGGGTTGGETEGERTTSTGGEGSGGELRRSPLLGGGSSNTEDRRSRLIRPGDRSPAAEERDALRSPYNEGGANGGSGGASGRDGEGGRDTTAEREERTSNISMLVSYKMRRIKVSGRQEISLKKYTLDTQPFVFTANIGGLRNHMNNEAVFKAVNLDDPVFKQREVLVALDGQDADDFDKFINYVTVQIRKKHQNGEITPDEIKIDKTNFQQSANYFRMVYGWKGDNDRAKWLEFEYRARWSFHGGATYETPWIKTDDFMITVSPPTDYRTIRLEADPEMLKGQRIRHVEATVNYTLFDTPFSKKVTLSSTEEAPAKEIEYVHERGDYNYGYELAWRLLGNKWVRTGPQQAEDTVIYCDELPEETGKP
ncbi:MAG: hypothetical protein JW889_10465 [Verrucomicrobia bacterium]|nr:hypothetical protein [Verrucomicrobiota bacterium]